MTPFNWQGFFGYFGNGFLWQGLVITLWLTAIPIVLGLVLGMVISLMRMSGRRSFDTLARFYIWIFRGTPLLIQLVIVYAGLPQLGIRLGVVASALVALTLNEAAYLSEIIRSGFMGVPKGQSEAAASLGLRSWQVVWKVTLPQAFRLMIPAFGNSINSLLKSTSITSVISMEELMRRSQMVMQEKFDVLEVFACAAILYLMITTVWGFFQRRLEIYFQCDSTAPTGER